MFRLQVADISDRLHWASARLLLCLPGPWTSSVCCRVLKIQRSLVTSKRLFCPVVNDVHASNLGMVACLSAACVSVPNPCGCQQLCIVIACRDGVSSIYWHCVLIHILVGLLYQWQPSFGRHHLVPSPRRTIWSQPRCCRRVPVHQSWEATHFGKRCSF